VDISQVRWRKSSRSGDGGNGACVEVACLPADWRRSSRSGSGNNGDCVEVASSGGVVGVRDSKNPAGPVLVLPAAGWHSFVAALRHGALGHPAP
jgi:hypothetical protein